MTSTTPDPDSERLVEEGIQALEHARLLQAREESRVRERARSMGFKLEKSKVRNTSSPQWQTFQLIRDGSVVAWGSPSGYGLSLRDVEDYFDA